MIKIWKHFGEYLLGCQNKFVMSVLCAFAIFNIIAIGFVVDPWWLWTPLAVFMWFFFLPYMIYVIDRDIEKNPDRPKTLGNLLHILIGKS